MKVRNVIGFHSQIDTVILSLTQSGNLRLHPGSALGSGVGRSVRPRISSYASFGVLGRHQSSEFHRAFVEELTKAAEKCSFGTSYPQVAK